MALAIAEHPSVTLHAGDAFVCHPPTVSGGQADRITLRRVETPTEIVNLALLFKK